MIKKTIKSVCVFCGSQSGSNRKHKHETEQLGSLIAQKGFRLVYGGGNIGLMGILASQAQSNNCSILGVIPDHLIKKEVGKTDLKTLTVTENMHERKKMMYDNSDAFIVLPGGVGTLDEFFETLTWAQLGLHNKPVILLNIDNFWNPLLDLLSHQVKSGFMNKNINKLFITLKTSQKAIDYLLDSNRQLSPE